MPQIILIKGLDKLYKKEQIKGFEEYSVDTDGVVYSKKDRPLKYSINHRGYCIVNLMVNGKRKGFAVHTLVAKQFIENDDPMKTQVNHKDGNKRKNCVDNLEWTTPKENTEHSIYYLGNDLSGARSPNAKSIGAYDKFGNLIHSFGALSDAARFLCGKDDNYRHKQTSIYKAANGIRKTYKGFVWKYI